MKKVAIFVEGQTELHFVHRLIDEIAGYGKLRILLFVHRGGVMHPIRSVGAPEEAAEAHIMIVNCEGDAKVKSAILERKDRLTTQGYSYILGLQDLYPKKLDEFHKFQVGLRNGLDFPEISIDIFLAVKEVEAWFLNEYNHFLKIDSRLTPDFIDQTVGFNPETENAESVVNHPAGTLDKIYKIVGGRYKKKEDQTHRLVSLLDYSFMYLSLREKSNSLNSFISGIEKAIYP